MKKIYLLLFTAIISAGAFAQFVPVVDAPGTSGNIIIGTSNYHASESIYTAAELGPNNYTTAASAIQQIFFILEQEPDVTTVNNFSIYMKNISAATTTLANGTYNLLGYTNVFTGTLTATPAGLIPVILTTPFQRTAGSNLEVLMIRNDNVVHATTAAAIFDAAVGINGDGVSLSSRRYNSTVAPAAGSTTLTATVFRPAIAFNHTFAVDAITNDIIFPSVSCWNSPQSVAVEVLNGGTTNIAAGAANVTLHIRGVNTFTGSTTNTGIITPGSSEFVIFNNVTLSAQGNNFDTAWVHLAGDGTTYYDTLSTISAAAPVIATFPITENVEEFYPITVTSDLDVFRYSEGIVLDNLWTLNHGDYFNDFQTTHLVPLGWPADSAYYLFDSFSGDDSHGVESRLYSNCIDLTTATAAVLTFFMSHDHTNFGAPDPFPLDSMYVSVSTDRGASWTRIGGYQRDDASFATPGYQMQTLNLASYLGQTIQIGFEGTSQYGNAIALDNINITATLPVTVLSFNAQRNGRVNELNWRTTMEQNSGKFIIERSADGINFTGIGQVNAAGTSGTEHNYRFTDANPIKGMNYYRLRIVDLDNRFNFSEIRNVRNTGIADISFANPVRGQLDLKLDVEKADQGYISITDMSGKVVYHSTVNASEGTNNISIETGKFAPGLYIIEVRLSDNRIIKKFSKL